MHDEFAALTWPVAPRFNPSAMQIKQALYQRQADSEATLGASSTAIDLREHLKDSTQGTRRNSDTVIPDGQAHR
jgi:hypothetical protein